MQIQVAPEPTHRAVFVAGVIVMVSLDRGVDGRWRARHTETGAFGFGETEDDALEMLHTHLELDRRWYCGIGRDLPMTGPLAARRTAYARMFGESDGC